MGNRIVILNFSSRKVGNCSAIADYINDVIVKSNICVYNVGDHFAPCGNCQYECLKPNDHCPNLTQEQREILDGIVQSDMTVYIVPNFCGFPCANYFAFNERTVGYFNLNRELMQQYMAVKKKFIIVSNSESDTFVKAMEQQSKEPDILYLKTRKYGVPSTSGELMNNADAKADIARFLGLNIC